MNADNSASASTDVKPSLDHPPGTIFSSMAQCSLRTGVSKKSIKTAKSLGAPGFTPNGRVLWDDLGPYFKQHQGVIDANSEETLEYYKTQIAKRDVVLRDLQIQKAKAEMIDPSEVKKFLTEFAVILSSVLKSKQKEIRSKATGYEKLIDDEFVEIFNLMGKEIAAWTPK